MSVQTHPTTRPTGLQARISRLLRSPKARCHKCGELHRFIQADGCPKCRGQKAIGEAAWGRIMADYHRRGVA